MAAKRKGSKTRGSAWNDEEILPLMSIQNDFAIQKQTEDLKVNNGSIYISVSDELIGKGFERTAEQCKVRIQTLKRKYRESKAKVEKKLNKKEK